MKKAIDFFRNAAPLKLILIGIPLVCLANVLEKPFPNIAQGLQLINFILFFYAIVKFFSKK